MGLFGGGNSTSNTTNLTQTENSDSRVVADAGSTVVNAGGGSVSLIDEGATVRALDFARSSADLNSKTLAELIGLSRDTTEETRQAVSLLATQNNDAFQALTTAQTSAFERIATAQTAGFNALTGTTQSTLDKFIALAGNIAETGANSVNKQAESLASSFANVSGKSPDALFNLGILLVIGFAVWKLAK